MESLREANDNISAKTARLLEMSFRVYTVKCGGIAGVAWWILLTFIIAILFLALIRLFRCTVCYSHSWTHTHKILALIRLFHYSLSPTAVLGLALVRFFGYALPIIVILFIALIRLFRCTLSAIVMLVVALIRLLHPTLSALAILVLALIRLFCHTQTAIAVLFNSVIRLFRCTPLKNFTVEKWKENELKENSYHLCCYRCHKSSEEIQDPVVAIPEAHIYCKSCLCRHNLQFIRLYNTSKHCNICLLRCESPLVTLCGHLFCAGCLVEWANQSRLCPLCKTSLGPRIAFLLEQ